ncbi:hypothetical protein B0H11DRAFT_1989768 [Mycena galericulata]|nr:hypothetical protein B0H11DRAFT_1989768 [Mycena galericulata]
MARCSLSPFSSRCTILLPFQMIRLVAMALLAVTQLSGSLCRGVPGKTTHVRIQFTGRATFRRAVPEAASCIDSFLRPCFCSASTLQSPPRQRITTNSQH